MVNTNTRVTSKILVLFAALALTFSSFASSAHAQVSYGGYTAQTQDEMIAYLNSVVEQLLQRIAQQQGSPVQYNYRYRYQPQGQMQGTSYQVRNTNQYVRDNAEVDVETGLLRSTDDEVTFYGEIDLNRASYARVWFEYGENDRFDERTDIRRINNDDRFSADVDKDEFEEDEWYDYRAVAEDPDGNRTYGDIRSILFRDTDRDDDDDDDDEPDVETGDADDIDEDSAEIEGEVDMNDFEDGIVFFVYGEDEDLIKEIEDEYDEYSDIDEEGDDLQKFMVDSNLDDNADYTGRLNGLDDDTEYFYQICVEYEDEDDDETIACGGVESFETDRD